MTEKRFTHKNKSLYIDDDYFCELEDGDEITELLNRQQYTVETVWKENEQLKKDLKIIEEHRKQETEYTARLEEENEQLKQSINEVVELLSEEVDVFSEKATEHDITAYRELNQLDNKDAYYMATATKKAIKILKGCLNE